jgi:hypothetical protein
VTCSPQPVEGGSRPFGGSFLLSGDGEFLVSRPDQGPPAGPFGRESESQNHAASGVVVGAARLLAHLCKPEVTGSIPVRSIARSSRFRLFSLCAMRSAGGGLHPALRADLLPAAVGSQRRRSEARAQLPAVGDKRSPTTPLHPLTRCARGSAASDGCWPLGRRTHPLQPGPSIRIRGGEPGAAT